MRRHKRSRSLLQSALALIGGLACLTAACTGTAPTAATPVVTTQAAASPATAAIFLTPNSWDLPADGGTLDITVVTAASASGNVPAPDVTVSLSTTSGTLSNDAPRTDKTGHAHVTWQGTSSATITARVGDVSGTASIRVPAPPTTTTPVPIPKPNPDPKDPPPTDVSLFVEVAAVPRVTNASTPVAFSAQVREHDQRTPASGPFTYAWDFNQDGIADSTLAQPTHLFPPADHWNVTVTVTDARGRSGRGLIPVVVSATPLPKVTVTLSASPGAAIVAEVFTFTGQASGNVTSGPVVAYDWDFDTSTPGVDLTTTTLNATTTYATPGTRTVRVTARTATGISGSATTAVKVNDHPLVVGLAASAGPYTAPASLTFTASLSSLGSVPTSGLVFAWDFDANGSTDFTSTIPSATFTYKTPDTYDPRVTVTAPDGRTATNTITVVVK